MKKEDSNTAVVSVKVPRKVKEKMRSMGDEVKWGELLRKAIEAEIDVHERNKAVAKFLASRAKRKPPKNKTVYTSEVLLRETREDR